MFIIIIRTSTEYLHYNACERNTFSKVMKAWPYHAFAQKGLGWPLMVHSALRPTKSSKGKWIPISDASHRIRNFDI